MKIDSLKQLDRLLALCQKRGVTAITVDGVVMTIERVAKKTVSRQVNPDMFPEETLKVPAFNGTQVAETTEEVVAAEAIETDELNAEQLMFYSSNPAADQ